MRLEKSNTWDMNLYRPVLAQTESRGTWKSLDRENPYRLPQLKCK